jgi:hypothetical protein
MLSRSTARWLLRAVLATLLVCFTCTATAQTPPAPAPAAAVPTAQELAEAKKHFEIGLKLYKEGAFQEALAEFETSYRLGHRPSGLKSIAQCQRELKRFAEAYTAYRRLLDVHGAQLSPAEAATVKRTLEELAILIGSLEIKVDEPDAAVELDGNPLGPSPLAGPLPVGLGSHTVRVTKPGFEPFEKEVSFSSEQSVELKVALKHEKTTGHLAVREPSGHEVHVFVDGEDEGPAPWEGELALGDHEVLVKGDKFASEPRAVTIVRKERLDVALDATTLLGHLRVTTLPASAAIAVDGKSVGTGVWEADLAPGSHRVEVSLAGYSSAVRDLTLLRGQLMVQEIPLTAAVGEAASPDYAGLYMRINLFGVLSPTQTQIFSQDTPKQTHFGGGSSLHIGYSLDIFAIEFVGVFMVDHYDVPEPDAAMAAMCSGCTGGVTGIDGFFGLGGRVTSHGSTVRFTLGVAPGAAIHALQVRDGFNVSAATAPPCGGAGEPACNVSSAINNGALNGGYVAPGLAFDAGMLVGATPGGKFFLGVQGWVDFPSTLFFGPDASGIPSSVLNQPGNTLLVVQGPQFYFGPTLGLQFGH